jgi:formylglycine-generating enzyme required for sulfatase activity
MSNLTVSAPPLVRLLIAQSALLGIVWCSANLRAADEVAPQKPRDWAKVTAGQAVVLKLRATDGTTRDIAFRYCPAGEVVLGNISDDAGAVNQMKPFLMMETELSVGLAHALAVTDIWQRILNRVTPLNDPDAKRHLSAPDVSGLFPLTYINLDEAAQLCDSANRVGILSPTIPLSPIEAWEVRLPTHAEWMYGCRACPDRESARQLPHFSPWPQYDRLSKELKGKCADQWEGKLGRPPGTFTGSQQQVISLFDKYDKADNPGPAEILGTFMATAWWRKPASRVYTAASMTGSPRDPSELLPNAWGLRGMSDNAYEWVLCLSKATDVKTFCNSITMDGESTPAASQAVVFLAGGSTREYLEAKEDWRVYAVWGGRPMRDDGNEIDPRTWAAANGEAPWVVDYASGCRFVADRVLSMDWAVHVRTGSLHADDTPAVDTLFSTCEATIDEIMAPEEQGAALKVLATYEAIARYRVQGSAGAQVALRKTISESRTASRKPRITVDDLLGTPNTEGTSRPLAAPPTNEDELFSRALVAVVSAETTSK